MRVLIKHVPSTPNGKIHIDFNSEAPISELRKIISEKLNVPLSCMQLTTKKCGVVVLMTDTWPLSFFISSEKANIKLNLLETLEFKRARTMSTISYLTPNRTLSPIEYLIAVCKSGSLQALADFFEVHEAEIQDEDLLNQEQECKWGALHYACYFGHDQITKALVSQKVNCNKVSIDEWTPLQLSCYFNKLDCVEALLQHPNIQINKMTKFRGTGLHLACVQGNSEIVKLLLDNHAYMNIEDHAKKTPIEYARSSILFDILPRYSGMQQLKKYEQSKQALTPFCSEVYLTNSFSLVDKTVFLYMDIDHYTLKRYNKKEDYLDQKKAEHYIKINNIQDVVYSENKDQYIFRIITSKNTIKYYTKYKELTAEWINRIKIITEYTHINNFSENQIKNDEPDEEVISEESHKTVDFNSFNIIEEIGSGSFGTVYKVQKISTGEIYAMKSLNKATLKRQKQLKYAISECKIMSQLDHPFIVPLYYAFQTPKYLYLVLELCTNGDLFGFIEKKGRLEENVSKFYLAEVILAIEYLHNHNIIYRDLKPANVLIDKFGHARLADFGLAKEKVEKGNLAMTMAGSPAYLPPEIVLKKGASKASDIYGLGPLLFELLTGTTPYYCEDMDELFQNIKAGKLIFPNYISSLSREFITLLMNRDSSKRPQISQIKRHAFFRKMDWEALLAKRIRPPKLDFIQFEEIQDI